MSKVVRAVVGIGLIVAGVFMGGSTWPLAVMALGGGIAASAVTPKMSMPAVSEATAGRLNANLDPEAYRKIPFGITALATDTRYWEVYGADQKNYDQVIALGGCEIASLDALYIEDELVTFDGSGNAIGKYAGALSRKVSLAGVSGTTMSGVGTGTRWNTASGESASMTGIPYMVLKWVWSQEKLPRGFPTRITPQGKGTFVYDPRRDTTRGGSGSHRADDQSTWEFTPTDSNGKPIGRIAALQILRYLLGWYNRNPVTGEWVLVDGMGLDPDDIDFASFIQAANDCEAEEYYAGCLLSTGDNHATNLAVLEQACAGKVSDAGGRYGLRIQVNDFGGTLVEFTDDDIVGDCDWRPEMPLAQSAFNQVSVQFVDPDALYQLRSAPLVRDAAYEAADGERSRTNIRLDAVQDGEQAQKLGRLILNKSRRSGMFEAPFGWRAVNVEVGQPIKLTLSRFGFSERYFRVRATKVDPGGAVWMALEDDDPSVYTGGTVTAVPPAAAGAGYDPLSVATPDPGDWNITVGGPGIGQPGGPGLVIKPGVGVADLSAIKSVLVHIRLNGQTPAAVWTLYGEFPLATLEEIDITGLFPNTAYDVRLQYRNGHGSIDPEATQVFGPLTTGAMVADDANLLEGLNAAHFDDAITAAQGAADDAQAEVDAARDAVAGGQTDLAAALNTARDSIAPGQADLAAALNVEQTRVNESIDDAREEARVSVSRLSAPKQNLVLDALLTLGVRDWRLTAGGAPKVDEQTSPRALRLDFTASASGEAASAYLLDEWDVFAGERFELSGEADLEGVATGPVVRLVWLNTAGASVATSEIALSDLFARAGGFVTAPAGAASARLEVAIDATGAGDGAARFRRLLWRRADDGQSVISSFEDKNSPVVSKIKRETIAAAELVAERVRLTVSDGKRSAEIENIEITQTDGGSALAADLQALTVRTQTAESDIDSLQEAVVVGNLPQAKDILSLKIATRGLNAFDDPTFSTGYRGWSGNPEPPLIDETGSVRALVADGTAGASGTVASLSYGPKFRIEPDQGIEAAVDVKIAGAITSAAVKVRFYDASETLLSTATAGSAGGGASFARLGGFVTAPASAKYAAFVIEATGTAAAVTLTMRRPHFGGQADGQTVLTPFDATLSPRTSQLLRAYEVDSTSTMESRRQSVEAGNASALIASAETARVAGDSALVAKDQQLETQINGVANDLATNYTTTANIQLLFLAKSDLESSVAAIDLTANTTFSTVKGLAEGALPAADFNSTFTAAATSASLVNQSTLNSAITAIDLTAYTKFNTTTDTANAALPSDNFNGVFDTRFNSSIAALNIITESNLESSVGAINLSVNTDYATTKGKANAAAVIIRQATEPAAANYKAGDVWIDTDDGKQYVHNGTAWVYTVDGSLARAADVYTTGTIDQNFLLKSDKGGTLGGYSLVGTVEYSGLKSKADAAAVIVRQPSQPVAANYKANDIWIDTDDGDRVYVHNGTTWVLSGVATNAGVANTYSTFAGLQLAFAEAGLTLSSSYTITEDIDLPALKARAKTIVRQAAQPNASLYVANDLWFDTDDNDKLYIHNGTSWSLAGLATEAWANQTFTTSSDVTDAIAAYEFTLAAGTPDEQTGTIPALVNVNATAVKTLEGAAATYEIVTAASGSNPAIARLNAGVGGSEIQLVADALRFINDLAGQGPIEAMNVSGGVVNILTALVLASNATIKSSDGRMEIGQLANGGFGIRFRDPTTDQVLLVYDQTNEVFRIEPSFLAPGSVGFEAEAYLAEHVIAASNTLRTVDSRHPLFLYTDPALIIPNMIYTAEAQYFMDARYNAFEWYSFEDQIKILKSTEAGSAGGSGVYKDRRLSVTANTGWAPQGAQASLTITEEYSRRARFAFATIDPDFPAVRAALVVRATDKIVGGGLAYTASSFNGSLTAQTHKLTEIRLQLRGVVSGPTVIA